jgi:hypothetical protein
MRRALDRLRRAAVKIIDSPDGVKSSDNGISSAVQALLMDIATTLEALLSSVSAKRHSYCHCLYLIAFCRV